MTPRFSLALAAALMFTVGPRADAAETTATASTEFVDVQGTRIAFREIGSGDPIILLQRFRASMDDWDPAFVDALAADRRVILLDNAGVGESDGTVQPTLEEAADLIVAFSSALGLGRPDVLGWSMGGMTAQILATKHRGRLDKLVLVGTLPQPGGTDEIVITSGAWGDTAAKPVYTDDDLAFLFFSESEAGKAAAVSSNARISARRPATENKVEPDAAQRQYGAILGFFRGDGGWYWRLGEIEADTLVVNGDRDGAFPAINSVILAREIPDAQLAIYPDGGHGVHMQYPEKVAADVNAFLGEQ